VNGQHNAGIHGWGALPQPPWPPQIDKLGSGGIQLGRWKTLLTSESPSASCRRHERALTQRRSKETRQRLP
jgi:hypothetical protein